MPSPAPRLLVEQRRHRHRPVRLRHRERLEHPPEVLGAAIGLDHFELLAEHHQADAAALVDEQPRDRGRRDHRGLDARVVALAGVLLRQEVQHHPHVRGRIELEGLHLEFARPQRAGPVDAVDAVARLVVADAGRVGRHVVRAPPEAPFPRQVGRRRRVARQIDRARIDDQRAPVPEAQLAVEDPERIARAHADRPQLVDAAPPAGRLQAPRPPAVGPQRGDELGPVARQRRGLLQLQPQLGRARGVFDLEPLDDRLARLHAVAAARHPHVQPQPGGPGPERGQGDAEQQRVAEPQRQPVVGGEADAERDQGQDHQQAERTPAPERRAPSRADGAAHLAPQPSRAGITSRLPRRPPALPAPAPAPARPRPPRGRPGSAPAPTG